MVQDDDDCALCSACESDEDHGPHMVYWSPQPVSWKKAYPVAYHVFPLHAARDIFKAGALRSKARLADRRGRAVRSTTSAVDEVLGFSDVVHLYLQRTAECFSELPILAAQLQPSSTPPFPHAVLALPTGSVSDECLICCWSIAVSQPQTVVNGVNVKGGNWARGTSPERIAEVWAAFRQQRPPLERARGYWVDPMKVPVLSAVQLDKCVELSRTSARGPELLIPREVALGPSMTFFAFCEEDERLLRLAGLPANIALKRRVFPDYGGANVASKATYESIQRYILGEEVVVTGFDTVRPQRTSPHRR